MRRIVIREDALQAIKDRAMFPLQQQQEAGDVVVFGKTVKLFFIEIDVDVKRHIRSKGVNLDDVDQVSDIIISTLTTRH